MRQPESLRPTHFRPPAEEVVYLGQTDKGRHIARRAFLATPRGELVLEDRVDDLCGAERRAACGM